MTSEWFAMEGGVSGELLSYRGRVLVHDNPREVEYLVANVRVVSLGRAVTPDALPALAGRTFMYLKNHPDMLNVRWPLRRDDFVLAGRNTEASIEFRRRRGP